MILVDTSVIIDFLNGKQNEKVTLFDRVLENRIPYGISPFIFQEVLQGAKDLREYRSLKDYLESIPFYHLKDERESYERAAFINFTCRRVGKTIRSTIDLLIAQTAIENDLFLLHKDDDFERIAQAVKTLKIYNGTFS